MKPVNKAGKEVLDRMYAMTKLNGGYHLTIDNTDGTYMPVHVEIIGNCSIGDLVSVAHYYEQNGDMMRDPDMVFIYANGEGYTGQWYPISFRQDGCMGVDQESVTFNDRGEPSRIRRRQQAQHATFAGQWMRNIKCQQGLTAKATGIYMATMKESAA